ncbi:hypothetical protein [Leucobacter aridicollis]
MAEDDDYIDVVGRIKKQDLDGNEITNETLGSGGSRREDGTLSKMVEDLRIVDSDDEPDDGDHEGDDPDSEGGDAEADAALAAAFVLIVVTVVVTVVAVKAAPHVKSWWDATVAPRLSEGWRRLRETLSPRKKAVEPAPPLMLTTGPSSEVELAVQTEVATLTPEEAVKLYVEAMTALSFAADRMRTLQNARIEEPEKFEALERAARQLTTPEATEEANRQLEAAAASLKPEQVHEFVRIYGGGAMVEGIYLPLKVERVREVLRLPGEPEVGK